MHADESHTPGALPSARPGTTNPHAAARSTGDPGKPVSKSAVGLHGAILCCLGVSVKHFLRES